MVFREKLEFPYSKSLMQNIFLGYIGFIICLIIVLATTYALSTQEILDVSKMPLIIIDFVFSFAIIGYLPGIFITINYSSPCDEGYWTKGFNRPVKTLDMTDDAYKYYETRFEIEVDKRIKEAKTKLCHAVVTIPLAIVILFLGLVADRNLSGHDLFSFWWQYFIAYGFTFSSIMSIFSSLKDVIVLGRRFEES